jgi:rfaE bifunctional protein kinase chain/domain
MELFNKFSGVNVLVVGDIMLDRYWWGDVSRISPEAPVPVVEVTNRSEVPGGAAKVARTIAGLGATAKLFGAIGADADGQALAASLGKLGLASENLLVVPERHTTVKTRIVAHGQHVVRVDQEAPRTLPAETESQAMQRLEPAVAQSDIVLISDYGKGFLTTAILDFLIRAAQEAGKPVAVDPKGRDFRKYAGVSVITPNKREALDASSIDGTDDESVDSAGKFIASTFDIENVLITLSEHGMAVFEGDKEPLRLAAEAVETYDVTGAGDTVIACIAVAMAAGLSLAQAAKLANTAAGVVVAQVGTSSITIDSLSERLRKTSNAVA